CDISPRAASWLEHHGFTDVADYAGGKMDWLAHGLPYEGAADLVGHPLQEVPTCTPDEPVAEVAGRLAQDTMAVVIEPDGIVVGVIDHHAITRHSDQRADHIAAFGPTSVRPSEDRWALDERRSAADV